jgi:hypothetical protein
MLNSIANLTDRVKWNARALIEGRKIAKKLAKDTNMSATSLMPDTCELNVKTGVLTFAWTDGSRTPEIITTYANK